MVAGICVGWLVGLSVSPVTGAVVASLTAAVVSLAAALAGLEPAGARAASEGPTDSRDRVVPSRSLRIDTIPLTCVLLGIVVGSSGGIYVRTHALLSPSQSTTVQRLDKGSATALYTASDDECARFKAETGERLRSEMRSSVTSTAAREFADSVEDAAALKSAVRIFICAR